MMLGRIKKLIFGGSEESIYFKNYRNEEKFRYEDSIGSMIESPYETFEKGDSIMVKKRGEDYRVPKILNEKGVFVRDRLVYSSQEFCPRHEIKKFRDEKRKENYCPRCE